LIKSQPHNAELYSLRALEDEQQLDFTAAESDWESIRRQFFRQNKHPSWMIKGGRLGSPL
jgi:hypothetical protein